jgi:hypothetical protein
MSSSTEPEKINLISTPLAEKYKKSKRITPADWKSLPYYQIISPKKQYLNLL